MTAFVLVESRASEAILGNSDGLALLASAALKSTAAVVPASNS